MKKIDYYFDFLSPFSYFSWINTQKLRSNIDIKINLKPVVMGTIFNHWEIKGPGEIAPKRYYMLKQCFQYAALNDIPFTPPKEHPFNPLYALRLATLTCSKDKQEKIINFLWGLCWAKGAKLGDEELLIKSLNEAGFDGEQLMETTYSKEVKLELKANTKEAISNKVFGVPSFMYDNELYWGNDSLVYLEKDLSAEKLSWNVNTFIDRTKDIVWEKK